MYKVDLHTHSILSPDGGITEKEYTESIAKKVVDYIAITDHNMIAFAVSLHKKLGQHIIVGEEIMTKNGEIIGLFLVEKVEPFQSISQTITAIHAQGGLVYVPHPCDSLRHGIGWKGLLTHRESIDIIEGFNARMVLRWYNKKAKDFAEKYHISIGVGSDAHGVRGLGSAYAMVPGHIAEQTLKKQLQGAQLVSTYQPWYAYLYPLSGRLNIFIKSLLIQ